MRGNYYARCALYYVKDIDTYFTAHCYGVEFTGYTTSSGRDVYYRLYELQPVNIFGEKEVVEDNENTVELGIVPAWIDYTDKGNVIFLDVPEQGVEVEDDSEDHMNPDGSINWNANTSNIMQPYTYKLIKAGAQDSSAEYYDKLYVAFWKKCAYNSAYLPCPWIDKVVLEPNWEARISDFSMRLTSANKYRQTTHTINGTQKYTFKFLCDEIPNPRSLFYIQGQKYICQKITATFKDGIGRSKLLKGVFYKVE